MSKSETSICKCGDAIEADHQYVRYDDYAAAIAHNEYLLARLKKSDAQLAAIKADRKQRFENGEALKRYKECGAGEEQDTIERLRFFCSLAMSGQDWLDSEQFFEDLIADRQRRGEPVAWQWLDTAHFRKKIPSHSNAEEWRPLFTAPQPANYCTMGKHACSDPSQCWEPCGELGKSSEHAKVADPVKVPIDDLAHEIWAAAQTSPGEGIEDAVERVAALLARYGHPAEPEGWQLVPKEPTEEMMYMGVSEWATHDDSEEDVYGVWEAMLEAAPKFGEEE